MPPIQYTSFAATAAAVPDPRAVHTARLLRAEPPSPPPAALPLRGLALDGKTVRGALAHGHACHLVSLVDHTQALVLRQVRVPAKTNEITAAPLLLRRALLRD